jgi:uncharacterized delta-60 repeat protein
MRLGGFATAFVRRVALLLTMAATVSAAVCAVASAAPGDLDRTFSGNGKTMTRFPGGSNASGLAIQADGRIVAVGNANFGRFALARYRGNGTLDATFSGDGKVTTNIAGSEAAFGVALQADGKIVAAGFAFVAGNSVFALARYNADGTLDTTFSGDGKATTDFAAGNERAWDVAIQLDGKIVAAGEFREQGSDETRFALTRYNADGTLDSSFDGDGRVLTDFAPEFTDAQAHALAIQVDGKIVAAGEASRGGDPETGRFALARYNTDGTLDTTFSGDGRVRTDFRLPCPFDCSADIASDVAIQANGKIVAAGVAEFHRFALARYNPDGRLDGSFSNNGKVMTRFPGGSSAQGVAIQADGKIIAAGGTFDPGRLRAFALARYNRGGRLDTTFSGDGKLQTNFTRRDDFASGVVIQPNGRIVAAGSAGRFGGRFALARYRG